MIVAQPNRRGQTSFVMVLYEKGEKNKFSGINSKREQNCLGNIASKRAQNVCASRTSCNVLYIYLRDDF